MNRLIWVLCFLSNVPMLQAKDVKVLSPDQKTELTITAGSGDINVLSYSISHQGNPILAKSPLGLEFENERSLSKDLAIVSVKEKVVKESWKPVYGEKDHYLDHYKEITIQFKESKTPYRSFSLTARVYNEGVAFKYNVPTTKALTITGELTGFKFSDDHTSWIADTAQGKYSKGSIGKTLNGTERPYVIEMSQNSFIALGEAALVDHARMKFSRSSKDSLLILATLDGKSVYQTDFSTPWRYVMIAESAGKLLANNGFILNLNHSNEIKDPSWIKPGKVIREITLTTIGGRACVDFAAKHHLQYVEFDAGWYGHEYDNASSALAVNVDSSRSLGPLALQEIIQYGKSKGVGVILYVNQRALSRELDAILPLFQSWGVKGMKYGFVDVGPQNSTSWLHEAVRKAADHQLMVDIHDEYRPTGYSRTYPNLLTQEGIRGDEESPDNHQVLTTLFTRMIAGAGDQTNCYFAPRVKEMGSHASQMAKAICIYSPWQFLYWYDRPAIIDEIPDLDFYDALPTVWDDTKVIEGKIGEYGTIARRKGKNWFIGSLTDQARNLVLPLHFLSPGMKYEATVYADDASLPTTTKIAIKKMKVNASTVLNMELMAKNGLAIIVRPVHSGFSKEITP